MTDTVTCLKVRVTSFTLIFVHFCLLSFPLNPSVNPTEKSESDVTSNFKIKLLLLVFWKRGKAGIKIKAPGFLLKLEYLKNVLYGRTYPHNVPSATVPNSGGPARPGNGLDSDSALAGNRSETKVPRAQTVRWRPHRVPCCPLMALPGELPTDTITSDSPRRGRMANAEQGQGGPLFRGGSGVRSTVTGGARHFSESLPRGQASPWPYCNPVQRNDHLQNKSLKPARSLLPNHPQTPRLFQNHISPLIIELCTVTRKYTEK